MAAIAQAALPAGVAVEGLTVASGNRLIVEPDGLATAVRAVAALGPQLRAAKPDGIIVSAFGDPGLDNLRGLLDIPVTGIAEAGMAEAAAGRRPFAVVTTTQALHAAIAATAARYGHGALFRGTVTTLGNPAVLMQDPQGLIEALARACEEAIRRLDAQAIVIGGGPLAAAARALVGIVSVPLIQPVPAAARLALMRVVGCDPRNADRSPPPLATS